MTALQCPVCELKFSSDRDMIDHISLDHPDFDVNPKDPEDKYRLERRERARKEPDR